jgi:hypothetical protein
MASFDDREKQFEAKFGHDQELQFKVRVRRNRLFGEWVGEQIGLGGEDLNAYARSVVESDFNKPGDDDVIEKVMEDLRQHKVEISEHRVRRRLEEMLAEARRQVMSD